jgi:hypothetical protein
VLTILLQSQEETEANQSVLPPINYSDLESSTLMSFGEGEVSFDQNTVPFDFDGKRLLWLTYKDRDVRELNYYSFLDSTVHMIHRFSRNDGMISQVRFLKTGEILNPGNFLFFAKDTKQVVKLDLKNKSAALIGTTDYPIIAMNVYCDKVSLEL